MPVPLTATASAHTMMRLDIPTGHPFDEFHQAFEAAVPAFDLARNTDIATSGGSWSDVRQAAIDNAPHDFMLYATVDARPLMALAGHTTAAVEYLMGNHVIAERMFRHHPDALLYVPPRVLLYSDGDGLAVFALDQPSTTFAGLGRPEIDEVGKELDSKLADLLSLLDVAVPPQLLGCAVRLSGGVRTALETSSSPTAVSFPPARAVCVHRWWIARARRCRRS